MDSVLRVQARFGQHALLLTTAAVPLTGWTVHAVALHRRLAATRKDPLTGLLRRDAYDARARQVLRRHGDDTAVVLVAQDHFKAVNDTMGHAAGDAVLTATAVRLSAWAGPRASVGRLGGDEFAVVLQLPADRRAHRLEHLVRVLHTLQGQDGPDYPSRAHGFARPTRTRPVYGHRVRLCPLGGFRPGTPDSEAHR
ncbi:GGDEF domain-containing protein [Streptomyces diastatochromogenes]|uniref:GGDEF domain-containing protein n=1 Tax=Streptomyces diastatochromogenes TaxID=42236 RepID=UPI00367D2FE2